MPFSVRVEDRTRVVSSSVTLAVSKNSGAGGEVFPTHTTHTSPHRVKERQGRHPAVAGGHKVGPVVRLPTPVRGSPVPGALAAPDEGAAAEGAPHAAVVPPVSQVATTADEPLTAARGGDRGTTRHVHRHPPIDTEPLELDSDRLDIKRTEMFIVHGARYEDSSVTQTSPATVSQSRTLWSQE